MKKNSLVSVVIISKDRKKNLITCIDSYIKSSYRPLEIIVVDNASKKPIKDWLSHKFKKIHLITLLKNLGAAGGRNKGLGIARGKYILFADDDSIADKEMIKELISVFKKKDKVGIVQPLIYEKENPQILEGAGHDINLLTGKIRAWGAGEKDRGQYEGIRPVPMCGCVWMVKKDVFKKIGNFDEEYFIPYEDSDLCIRAKNASFTLWCTSKAKAWHPGEKKMVVNKHVQWLGISSIERAYRVSRNKIIFMKKHAPIPNSLLFFFLFLPMYVAIHSVIILESGRGDILNSYWRGVISGIKYIFK